MKKLFLLAVMLNSLLSNSQVELPKADADFKKYLNDGKRTDADADVKMSISAMAAGFIDVGYEHKIDDTWSVTGSAALQVSSLIDLSSVSFGFEDSGFKSGFGLGLEGRHYGALAAITDLGYWGFKYRIRRTNFEFEDVVYRRVFQDIYYTRGNKYLLGTAMSAELSYGLGMRYVQFAEKEDRKFIFDYEDVGLLVNLEVKLGYYIKY